MFSKKYRIKSSEINQIFKEKTQIINSEDFFFKIKENNLDHNRFAIIVPKRIYKTAVARHLYKRKIIAALKKIDFDSMDTGKNTKTERKFRDIVITVKKNISEKNQNEIQSQLAQKLI